MLIYQRVYPIISHLMAIDGYWSSLRVYRINLTNRVTVGYLAFSVEVCRSLGAQELHHATLQLGADREGYAATGLSKRR